MIFFFPQIFHLLFVICVSTDPGVNLFNGNPYENSGPFSVSRFHIERTEYQTFVLHPAEPGNYSVMFFIGGFAGVIPSELYSDFLSRVSSFGVVVVGFDIIAPWKKPEKFFKEYEFLLKNLQSLVTKHSEGVIVKIEEYSGIFCHSGGCELSTKLIIENQEFAKLAVFIDPVGYIFPPMKVSIPTFITGGGIPGNCAEMGNISYHRFYEEFMCPKIMYNQTDYAHCAPINKLLVKPCSLFCGGGKKEVESLHKWISGIVISMISVIFKAGKNCAGMKDYLLEASKFPISTSEFHKDFSCLTPKDSCLV